MACKVIFQQLRPGLLSVSHVAPKLAAKAGRPARVKLEDVALGPWRDDRIAAWVNEGEMDGSLLGMDYLGQFHVELAGDRMVLRR